MSKVIIVGAGGVGNVTAHKCAQVPEIFSEIVLASRTLKKCDAIAADVLAKQGVTLRTAQLDADDV
ncbi:MAG: saccharopine dehydrogenase NADP-binding domain-containing protein, partial [Coraliomargarita sp.]